MKKLLTVSVFVLSAFGIYTIGSAVYVARTTGVLNVETSDMAATITVSQPAQGMSNLGRGNTRVRLKPGDYTLIVSKDRTQVVTAVHVYIKSVTSKRIQLVPPQKQKTQNSAASANLLIKLLPFYGPNNTYKVDYSYNFSGQAAQPTIIVIAPNEAAKDSALSWIRAMGIDPSQLPVKYQSSQP